VEAYLPELGWIGFDPTNNIIAAERHVRVALGRDYADVPPTRGTYKGTRKSTLRVGVTVARASFPARDEIAPSLAQVTQDPDELGDGEEEVQVQGQQ
jgi:transglutaminase-like putative cysteine protease